MGENLRVTGVATGLVRPAAARPQRVQNVTESLRTGTDNMAVMSGHDFGSSDVPAVIRNPRSQASAQVRALETAGMEHFDIPAFLRKHADQGPRAVNTPFTFMPGGCSVRHDPAVALPTQAVDRRSGNRGVRTGISA